tara:strand:+ start:235 stop:726 length:492 start_codon:yes stop_codon:yes gene_type:complete
MIKKIILLTLLSVGSVYAVESEESLQLDQKFCLAKNIYFESGNQPLAGKVAVAHVTLNRVKNFQFPNTICSVVYQAQWKLNWKGKKVPRRNRCQFSWFCDGKPDKPTDSETWMESTKVAEQVLNNKFPDITEKSLWYHADYVQPNWSNYLNKTVQIEDHIFYK